MSCTEATGSWLKNWIVATLRIQFTRRQHGMSALELVSVRSSVEQFVLWLSSLENILIKMRTKHVSPWRRQLHRYCRWCLVTNTRARAHTHTRARAHTHTHTVVAIFCRFLSNRLEFQSDILPTSITLLYFKVIKKRSDATWWFLHAQKL